MKEMSKKYSIPLEKIENFFSAFVLCDEMTDQVRNHLEKSNLDEETILEIMDEIHSNVISITMAAKINNPKLVNAIKDIIIGDFDIEQLNGDK